MYRIRVLRNVQAYNKIQHKSAINPYMKPNHDLQMFDIDILNVFYVCRLNNPQ
jgi:hypothetical protein